MADLDARASRIAHAAGPGFTLRQARKGTAGPRPRARESVGTTDDKSRRKQAEENVHQRALNADRGGAVEALQWPDPEGAGKTFPHQRLDYRVGSLIPVCRTP